MGQRAERNDYVRHEGHTQLHQLPELLRPFGPFDLWIVGQPSRIWKFLAPLPLRPQLDALHERAVDSRSASRLDLGKQRTLGMDAVSLRNLAAFPDSGMGLGPGRSLRAAPVASGARQLGARRQSSRLGSDEPERSRRCASEPGAWGQFRGPYISAE